MRGGATFLTTSRDSIIGGVLEDASQIQKKIRHQEKAPPQPSGGLDSILCAPSKAGILNEYRILKTSTLNGYTY